MTQRKWNETSCGVLSTSQKAKEIYGVVFKSGNYEVDQEQTKLEREQIRAKRIPNDTRAKCVTINSDGDYIVLKQSEEGVLVLCSKCQGELSHLDRNWKESVPHVDFRMDEIGVPFREMTGWSYVNISAQIAVTSWTQKLH